MRFSSERRSTQTTRRGTGSKPTRNISATNVNAFVFLLSPHVVLFLGLKTMQFCSVLLQCGLFPSFLAVLNKSEAHGETHWPNTSKKVATHASVLAPEPCAWQCGCPALASSGWLGICAEEPPRHFCSFLLLDHLAELLQLLLGRGLAFEVGPRS